MIAARAAGAAYGVGTLHGEFRSSQPAAAIFFTVNRYRDSPFYTHLDRLALMQQAMEPNAYARRMAGMMNPATLQSYQQFVDPALYARWMQAAMNPALYNGFMGPANYMNWMSLPANPQMWNQGMQMVNPALYLKWLGSNHEPGHAQHDDGAYGSQPVRKLDACSHKPHGLRALGSLYEHAHRPRAGRG